MLIEQEQTPALRWKLFLICVLAVLLTGAQAVLGRVSHAGEQATFMDNKKILAAMFPAGANITQREDKLDENGIAWADEYFGVTLDRELHAYYLARDKKSGKVTGAAIITKARYRDGEVSLAIGIDNEQNVTAAAVTGVNEKYVKDFESSIGTGLLPRYAKMSLFDFMDKTKGLASADQATALAAGGLRNAAVLLTTFLRGID